MICESSDYIETYDVANTYTGGLQNVFLLNKVYTDKWSIKVASLLKNAQRNYDVGSAKHLIRVLCKYVYSLFGIAGIITMS